MNPSPYQTAIFEHIKTQEDNLVVSAMAGSGKTSTVVEALKVIPRNKNVLFVAFNKHIAEELARRVPLNVESSTLNAFGYRIMRNSNMNPKLNVNKVKNIVWYKIYQEDNFGEYIRLVGSVLKLVSLFKALGITSPTEEDGRTIADRFGIPIIEEKAFVVAIQAMQESLRMTQVIDFDDQLLYPIHFQLNIPKYDYVFVDEAQDLNLIQIQLVCKASRGMIVAVGDPNQAIYGFRGADPNAIQEITDCIHAITLPLSICYRCAKSVVKEAQQIVPTIEYSETQQEGLVETIGVTKYREVVKEGDWVLCRTTAPLVHEALLMLRNKRKAIVKGRQIGEALLSLAERVNDLDQYEMEQTERLKNNETALIELQDQLDTIRALIEAYGREGLKDGIEQLFGEETTGIMYCTIHRSKGLETNRVFLICPELLPHPKCTKDWQLQQEKNLHYIAITRAKVEFRYVEGKIK